MAAPRRSGLLAPLLGAGLLGACAPAAAPEAEELPPSVVLISLDAVRADHLGFYGYERDTTPRLDRFAGESLVFERAFTTAPWTLVAHMGMLTGLYPSQHGILGEGISLSPEVPTLAERLSAEGYHTAALFFPGWIDERFGYHRGFDVFRSHESAAEADGNLRRVLAERPENRPLFLFLHLFDAHALGLDQPNTTIYVPPPAYEGRFLEDDVARLRDMQGARVYNGQAKATAEQLEALVALYDSSIAYLDDVVADWLEAFEEEGFYENSIVILTSDHGEALGQRRGKIKGHGGMWLEGLRVPLAIRVPAPEGAPPAERPTGRFARPVSHVDLFPTVMDLLGLECEPWRAGYSLVEGRPETPLLARMPSLRAIIAWPWKLVGSEKAPCWQLSNLEEHPLDESPYTPEASFAGFARVCERLRQAADDELASRPPPPGEPVLGAGATAEEEALLKALGYLDD